MHDTYLTNLLLPWFPIVLGVGVGGRLLGRRRGFGLGAVCALFWILLVLASAPSEMWRHGLSIAAVFAGALAIVVIGGWAGELTLSTDSQMAAGRTGKLADSSGESEPKWSADAARVHVALQQFQEWLDEHRSDSDPWLAFDELIRATLRQTCGANRVRPYRALVESAKLIPLRSHDAPQDAPHSSARTGIVGHVVTSGRSYVAGDSMHGNLVDQLAHDSDHAPSWCFAIKQGSERFGVVVAQELDTVSDRRRQTLELMEKIVNLWWLTLRETCTAREALAGDPVSGLHSREAFLRAAEHALAESYGKGEPVAMAVIAVERLRELNDRGDWESADAFVSEICAIMRRKVRSDDALGRLDGSRFLILLRRVDSELASLIVEQILSQMEAICQDESRWGCTMQLRCGLAGSGTGQRGARSLMGEALARCIRARETNERCVADLSSEVSPAGVAG